MNGEIIALASSQILRWIDELNGIYDADARAGEIMKRIRQLRREDDSAVNRHEIRRLYSELDSVQFKPDYMCLIIDRDKDYRRACKGFSINGIRYTRLLATSGGVKNSTIVFVSERHAAELKRRIDNGRDISKQFVPAKLEAYKALVCSASLPVSIPNGIAVVPDCHNVIREKVIQLHNDMEHEDGEPIMDEIDGYEIDLKFTDGCGMMLPSLAERWSKEIGLDYTAGAMNTRLAFEKGMVYAFDFVEFADKVAGKYEIVDSWGNKIDIRNVELVLTESMLKLWDSYGSIEEYLDNCRENGYTFGITKTCPEHLENERNTNYQFIQSYDLEPDEICELIRPTMNEIRDILGGDWRKTALFLNGVGMSEKSISRMEDDISKAILIDHNIINDPYVRGYVYQMIKNRIDEAKIGVLKVHGNYSIVGCDFYGFCQSLFGLPMTGLLKAGEIYNKYWSDDGAERLAAFRAPMSCHNSIRLVRPNKSEEASYWFQYIKTSTIFNMWDSAMCAMNGLDFDGDMVMLTDNRVLVDKLVPSPSIICTQGTAKKTIPTEEDLVAANIASFGNDIGKITNWTTTMYEIRSKYSKDSEEYKILDYRIKCGQLLQQDAIDKAKGIISKPMPRSWHDRHACNKIEDDEKRSLYRSISADKKPYFMRYIYPDLAKQYNTYIGNTNRNALRSFNMTVDEMMELPFSKLTDEQKNFLHYYDNGMPVGLSDCVMNKICRAFETEFDGFFKGKRSSNYDYVSMRNNEVQYTGRQYNAIQSLYNDYTNKVSSYTIFAKYERVDDDIAAQVLSNMKDELRRSCEAVCQNEDILCDIILDICYKRKSSKRFAWDMCGHSIIHNMLVNNGNKISFPVADDNGDIEFSGNRFSIIELEVCAE